MPENPKFPTAVEPMPPSPPGRLRQLGSRVLDFINPSRVHRREELQAQRNLERQAAEQAEMDAFLAYVDETTMVTTVVGANELEFTSPAGETLHEPAQFTSRGRAVQLGQALAGIYVELGPGEHPVASATAALDLLDMKGSHRTAAIENLAAVMPSEVFTHDPSSEQVSLGNIAVAGRQATDPERTAYRERQAAIKAAEIAAWKERHNKDKIDLTEHDHALVVAGRRRLYVPLDTPDSILAARVLKLLARHQQGERLEGLAIGQAVWGSMPTPERELFTSVEKEVIGRKSAVNAQVLEILYKLTGRLGMTREVSNVTFSVDTVPTVNFRTDPVEATDTAALVPVFPPGTPRRAIADFRASEISPDQTAMAQSILQSVLSLPEDTRMEDKEALAVLDFIMSRRGKLALRAALEATRSRRTLDPVLKELRRRVRTSLGPGYTSARLNRTIGGYRKAGKRVRQVGGELNGATTRWHIGIPGAEEEGRQ